MATPSFFSGDVQSAMDEYRKTKRQQAARQVGRGVTAAGLGARAGAQAGIDYLKSTPAHTYERDRARFMESLKAAEPYTQLAVSREQYIRANKTNRLIAELEAQTSALRAEADIAIQNARLREAQIKRQLAREMEVELRTLGASQQGYGANARSLADFYEGNATAAGRLRTSDLDAAQAQQGRAPLRNKAGDVVGYSGAPGGDWISASLANATYLTGGTPEGDEDPRADFTQAGRTMDPQEVINNPTMRRQLALSMAIETGQSIGGMNLNDPDTAQQFLDAVNERKSAAELGGEPFTMEDLEAAKTLKVRALASAEGLSDLPAWVPLAQASAESSSAGSINRVSAARVAMSTTEFNEMLAMPLETLEAMPLDPQLRQDIIEAKQSAESRGQEIVARALTDATAASPEQALYNAALNAQEVAQATGQSPAAVFSASLATMASNGSLPTEIRDFVVGADGQVDPTKAAALQNSGIQWQQGQVRESSRNVETTARRAAGAGVDTSGLLQAAEDVASMEDSDLTGRAAPDKYKSAGATAEEAASQAEQDVRRAAEDLESRGKTMVFGLEVDSSRVPQDLGGQIDLTLQLIEEYPQHPPLQQMKRDMMANPEFKKWQESRGYTGEPDDWMWREFQREYRIAKRMNTERNKARKRVAIRAGVVPGDQDLGDIQGPDIKDTDVLTRRTGREYRQDLKQQTRQIMQAKKQAEQAEKQAKKQAESVGAQIRARASLPPLAEGLTDGS